MEVEELRRNRNLTGKCPNLIKRNSGFICGRIKEEFEKTELFRSTPQNGNLYNFSRVDINTLKYYCIKNCYKKCPRILGWKKEGNKSDFYFF